MQPHNAVVPMDDDAPLMKMDESMTFHPPSTAAAGTFAVLTVSVCSTSHQPATWIPLDSPSDDPSKPQLQIAVGVHHDHPMLQVAPPMKTFEIEAVDLSYKAPTKSLLAHDVLHRVWKSNKDKPHAQPTFILKNVSFKAKPGEILAIAGPSGAGKSTLLELLAGEICPSSARDSILINQQPMEVATFRRVSGYIPQSDALFPLLTVKETLLFSAHLRLPPSISSADKVEKVHELMKELRLTHVADMRIGNVDVRGISGGERRRVSIGVDVIHDPAVLLLDEPTSGLDSASALCVVDMLRGMAKTRSRTIVLSIHQPGYRIIQKIYSFLLLADGRVVHHGSLESLHCNLVAAGHKIPPQVNLLEYAIDNIVSNQHTCVNVVDHSCDHDAAAHAHQKLPHQHDLVDVSRPSFANSNLREVAVLSQRFTWNVFRTHELFTARTLHFLFAGLALGSLYLHVGADGRGVVKRFGFFAFTLTFLLSTTVEALPIFLQERQVFMHETSRGAYRISSYLMSNFLVFLPFLLLLALLYSIPVYWLIGLSSHPSAFNFFVLVVWLVLLMANSFVALLSVLVPDYIMANSMVSACMGAFFLFSGYFISKQDMPSYWRFMHYISLFKYPLDALLINEYGSMPGKCFGMILASADQGGGCTLTSEDVLRQAGLSNSSKWSSVLVMVVFVCGYRLLCYGVLELKACKRKK